VRTYGSVLAAATSRHSSPPEQCECTSAANALPSCHDAVKSSTRTPYGAVRRAAHASSASPPRNILASTRGNDKLTACLVVLDDRRRQANSNNNKATRTTNNEQQEQRTTTTDVAEFRGSDRRSLGCHEVSKGSNVDFFLPCASFCS
jgi:hypothetical protein